MNETYKCKIMSRDFVIWWYCDFNFFAVITYGFSCAHDLIHTHPNYIYLYCITAIKQQISYFQLALTTISLVCFFSIFMFNICIYCRKIHFEFNKLINTVGHSACYFEKGRWSHPPLPTSVCLFGYFHILTYQVLKL